ncbi:MAG: hypothetical protein WCA20_31975 [Candidatus Sulfotelmatobacter sp.]
MRKLEFRLCGLLLVLLQLGFAQEVSFRITSLRPVEELRAEALKQQSPGEQGTFLKPDLVELVKLDPTIKLDIRYATTNNFLGTPIYTQGWAFLQRVVPGAHVVATDVDKGFAFPGIPDGAGRYLLRSSGLVTINGPRELQLGLKVYF